MIRTLERPERPRILIIGSGGQLGYEMRRTAATLGEVIAVDRETSPLAVDLASPDAIRALLDKTRPDWIVNTAAYTAVDQAESDEAMAHRINAEAPGILAEEAHRLGALLLHFSTDYVFDGMATAPYREADPTAPQSVYGRTKLAGEQAVMQATERGLIFRTAWLYGARGRNFMLTIQRLAREREEIAVVGDQVGSPTWARSLAEASAQVLAQIGRDPERQREVAGVYHLTCAGQVSWHDFAVAIVGHQRRREAVRVNQVRAIPSEQYPSPAPRPLYSVLDNSKVRQTFGMHMPRWDEALAMVQEDMGAG